MNQNYSFELELELELELLPLNPHMAQMSVYSGEVDAGMRELQVPSNCPDWSFEQSARSARRLGCALALVAFRGGLR